MGDSGIDYDGNLQISKGEFETLLLNKTAARMVQDVGVDVVGLVDFADFIFKDDDELSFCEFMELVLQLRGSNNATVKDVVDLRKFFITQMDEFKAELHEGLHQAMNDELTKSMSMNPFSGNRPTTMSMSSMGSEQTN